MYWHGITDITINILNVNQSNSFIGTENLSLFKIILSRDINKDSLNWNLNALLSNKSTEKLSKFTKGLIPRCSNAVTKKMCLIIASCVGATINKCI